MCVHGALLRRRSSESRESLPGILFRLLGIIARIIKEAVKNVPRGMRGASNGGVVAAAARSGASVASAAKAVSSWQRRGYSG